MKITSGPWIVRGSHHSLPQVWTADEQQCITDRVFNDENARLIAAAPELLAALRSLVYFHDTDDTSAFDNWEQARAAIAKATGQE